MDFLADIVREAAYEKNTKKDQTKQNTIQGQQEAADNDILFDEVFEGEMRDSYGKVRVSPDKQFVASPDEGGSKVFEEESVVDDDEPEHEELRQAILNYVTQIKDAN